MKSLRQLLRRPLHSSSATGTPKRRATQRYRSGNLNRRLSTQTLEQRQLLAGDIQVAHNYWNGYDVNEDRQISPSDALSVINYLSATTAQGEGTGAAVDDFVGRRVDVNADGNVTPSDALSVINALARGEQMSPLVEYFLTARDADDNLLPENGGVIEIGTGQENSFFLEVAYSDLRGFGDDKGAFSIFPDIGISQENALRPVLHEAQQLLIGEEIRDSSSGFLTIGREGSTDTVDITLGQLGAGDFRSEVSDALIDTWGLNASDFVITEPLALKGENGRGLGLQIKYVADNFGNVDIPDLTITDNFNNAVTVEFREFAPFEADGTTPNSAAVRFNLDVRSRTLSTQSGNNVLNNVSFYTNLHRGTFSLANGFTDIGGVGGANSVRDVDKDGEIIEPFDAFRIEVFIANPISSNNPLVVDVNPGEGVDPLTLYGNDGVVPEDLITIDDDARLTFSTGAVINNPPVLGTTPLTTTVSEDDGSSNVDLLQDATDADNDTLSVTGFSFTSGDTSGVTQTGSTVTINPAAYNALKVGESEVIVGTYTVTDGFAGSPTQNLTITITGANDAPVVTAAISETRSENAVQFSIDLLQNASDPDGDPLDATAIIQVGSEDNSGVTVDDTNNQLTVNPAAYASLQTGQSITLTYNFTVTDGNGGDTNSSVTITINGDTPNGDPVVSGPVILGAGEDDADLTLNLLDNASDPDTGDVLTVSGLTLVSGNAAGITDNGNTLSVSPSTYNALGASDVETIIYSYTISDGEGGSVAQTATITIGGVNDAPTVGDAISLTVSEDDSNTAVDLLSGASDPDAGDTVTVDNLTKVSGDNAGVSDGGNGTLAVDPSAYNSLAAGESEVITYTYDVIDGNGGVTAQSATITITGVNDAPMVDGAVTAVFTEDGAQASVDLLTGATDVDASDVLKASNLTTTSGDSTPFSLVNSDTTIQFDPDYYNSLAAGESEIIVLTYNVEDGNGGSASQTATITINGVNDAPVVGDALAFTFNEDQGTQNASLLDGASDPDTSDTLAVTNVGVTGDDSGITRSGADLSIDTSAYGNLNTGEQAVVVFTYNVSDGTTSVNQTATVTIEGRDEGIPVVSGPIIVSFDENDASSNVDLLDGASDPDSDPISVIDATVTSGDARGVTIDAPNNRLVVTPSAYADLDDGQSEVVVVSYKITDGQGNAVDQTATVTIVGQTIVVSTISGELFVDHIENINEVINGATPIRNGIKEDDESALGSVTILLKQMTPDGEVVIKSVLTNNDGDYSFTGLLPGTYIVEYMIPDSVQYTGSKRGVVVIGELGGESKSGPDLDAIGLTGVQQRLNLLVKSYLAAGVLGTDQLSGGSVQLNADGTQQMFVAEDGFDAKFAEVALNDARDSALLTIIDANDVVRTAQLSVDQFVVTKDGRGVRFFGTVEDYDFSITPNQVLRDEFDDYRKAIDKVLGEGV